MYTGICIYFCVQKHCTCHWFLQNWVRAIYIIYEFKITNSFPTSMSFENLVIVLNFTINVI